MGVSHPRISGERMAGFREGVCASPAASGSHRHCKCKGNSGSRGTGDSRDRKPLFTCPSWVPGWHIPVTSLG